MIYDQITFEGSESTSEYDTTLIFKSQFMVSEENPAECGKRRDGHSEMVIEPVTTPAMSVGFPPEAPRRKSCCFATHTER